MKQVIVNQHFRLYSGSVAQLRLGVNLSLCLWWASLSVAAQSGVLIPSQSGDKPDPATLSLAAMSVDVLIDNQHARVRVRQVFANHTAQVQEGKYLFALPPDSSIADFAVWDGDARIPGVIIEKRRADKIYGDIKQRAIDPGLLQQDDGTGGTSAFSAKVFPIPAYGSKRVEMEYTQMLPVEGLATHFTFPLKPSWGEPQRAGEFAWHVRVVSDHKIAAPQFTAQSYPLRVLQAGEHEFEGDFSARNLLLSEDFALDYQMSVPASELSFTAYRAPEHISAYDLRDPALAQPNPDGYFSARALFNQPVPSLRPARNILLVLDISLSMYGEKLVRAAEAAEFLLHNLGPDDHFNLMLFNETAHPLAPEPLTGTPENVEKALAFLKASALAAGTDLQNALAQAVKLTEKFPAGERSIILISDANPTWGTSNVKKILAGLPGEKEETGPAGRLAPAPAAPVRIFAFGLGRDANQTLLEELARQTHGHFAQARETEDISAALRLFLAHIGTPDWENLRLSGPADFYQVYALQDYAADGSSAAWVGRYRRPAPRATLNFTAQRGAETINLTRDVMLPELDDTHAHLPRLWARARVDALLRALDLDGEREDYISEIIRLSQRYKFVTPYTSFLAAPRSLLRPRLIQPGDPVLRVRTDESIVAVWAVLPFGETLPLHYLPQQKVWQCRFLAPSWLSDGTYRARLLLTDQDGNGYQEEKTFVIDSHAPSLRATLDKQQVHAGEELTLRVTADSDTFRLHAKMYGAQPAELRWSDADKANTGRLRVPAGLSAGRYIVTVTAEDFAHNQASLELEIEVL